MVHANEDYLKLIAGSDQKLSLDLSLGSSVKDVLSDKQAPLLDHLSNGFSLKAEV